MNETTIIRIKHGSDNPYFLMARATAQHKALTYEALGMLTYLLSKPDDWEVQLPDLMRDGTGRDRAQRILNELVEKGYARHDEQERGAGGKFAPVTWTIYEVPTQPEVTNPVRATPPQTEFGQPHTENQLPVTSNRKPVTGNPHLHNRDTYKREEAPRAKTPASVEEPAPKPRESARETTPIPFHEAQQFEAQSTVAYMQGYALIEAYVEAFPDNAKPAIASQRSVQRAAQALAAKGYTPDEVTALVRAKLAEGREYRFEFLANDLALARTRRAPTTGTRPEHQVRETAPIDPATVYTPEQRAAMIAEARAALRRGHASACTAEEVRHG